MSPKSACLPRRAQVLSTPVATAVLALCAQTAWAQASATQLVEVEVRSEATNASEATRSYENPVVSGATGLMLTRRETPQSIGVVTRQQMDDENVETLDDALLNATGITATQLDVGGRVSYRARGYEITNFRIDGLQINGQTGFNGQGMSINMDLYDRVEVLRGANGLLGSTGDPSGVVDLVRKEPRKTRFGSAGITVGSWGKKHLTADLNQPLNADGSVRARFVVSGDDSDSFRDRERSKSVGALASFAADLTSATTVGLGVQYERRRLDGATWGTNVPIWFADGTPTNFRRSLSAAANWSYSERATKTVFGSLDHRFNSDWSTRLTASFARGITDSHLAVAKSNSGGSMGFWNQDGTGAYLNTNLSENESTTRALRWTLNGNYQALGRTHQLMVGANYADTQLTSFGLNCFNAAGASVACMNRINNGFRIGDWRDFIASGASIGEVTAVRNGRDTETETKTYGGYLASRVSISEPLSVIVGARLSWQRNYTARQVSTAYSHKLTPYLGAVYDLGSHYSLYASYTDVFEAQAQRQVNGDYLDPKTGKAYEAGVKGEWLDGQVDGSMAFFYTKQKDLATLAKGPNGEQLTVTGEATNAYVNGAAGVRSRGFEVDFSGRITPNLNLYGGYTFLDVNNPNAVGTDSDPRHLLRFNASYRLPGDWRQFTVGAGMTAQSKMRQAPTGTSHPTLGSNVNIDLQGYALFHAMLRYEIDARTVATLNVSNLFDKTYYRQYGFYSGGIYGEPRSVTLNLRTSF